MSTRTTIVAGGIAVVLVAALGWWKLSGSDDPEAVDRGEAAGTSLKTAVSGDRGGGSPAPAAVTGRVMGPDGAPIAAVIRVSGPQTEIARAGAGGEFAITGLRPGSYRISAAAPGFRPAVSPALSLAAGASERVELTLEPGGRPIEGRVVNISGGPIAGAFVELSPVAGILAPADERGFAAITGADGRFTASAGDGVYVLSASHPEYVSRSERVEVRGAAREIEIALIPGGVIEGVVVDADSGEPVAGAAVTYSRSALLRVPGLARRSESVRAGAVTADAAGTFRITGIEPGVISLRAAGAGRVSREPVAVSVGIAESRTGVEIYVDDGFHIRGRVVDQSGAPVAGASVNASGERAAGDATTGADGRFDLGPVAPGSYSVFAMGGDVIGGFMHQTQVEIGAADVDGVRLEVTTGVRVRGRVSPPSVARVRLDPASGPRGAMAVVAALGGVQTEADGVFDLGPIPPGKAVTIEAVSEDGSRGEVEIDVGDRGVDGVVIELGAAARIAGRVTDSSGAPVAGVFVAASPAGGTSRVIVNGAEISGHRVTTGAGGRYELAGLEGGRYQVSVTDSGGQRLLWTRPPAAGPDAPLAIELGERESRTLDLSVKALDGVIRGVVRGPDGRPAPDVFVTATASRSLLGDRRPPPRRQPETASDKPEGEKPEVRSESMVMVVKSGGGGVPISGSVPPVVTDGDGRFAIRGLREGDYDLVAEGLGGSARAFADKVATGSDVVIDLVSLTALAGRVTMGGQPVEDFSVELTGPARFARAFQTEDGTFRMPRLDPGRYQLRVRGGGGEASIDVEVAAGKTTEVEVALQGQHKIRGRLVDAEGEPVARAMVLITPAQPAGEVSISISSSKPPPRSDDDGRFVTAALPGTYTLIALAPDAPRPLVRKRFDVTGDIDLGDIAATGELD